MRFFIVSLLCLPFYSSAFAFELDPMTGELVSSVDTSRVSELKEFTPTGMLTDNERIKLITRLTRLPSFCPVGASEEDAVRFGKAYNEHLIKLAAELEGSFHEYTPYVLMELILTEQTLSRSTLQSIVQVIDVGSFADRDVVLRMAYDNASLIMDRFTEGMLKDDVTRYIADNTVLQELPAANEASELLARTELDIEVPQYYVLPTEAGDLKFPVEVVRELFLGKLSRTDLYDLIATLDEAEAKWPSDRYTSRVAQLTDQFRGYFPDDIKKKSL
ncbi:MAG: hypothetical protein AAGI44_14265 [Pseudomonadota bacterium]